MYIVDTFLLFAHVNADVASDEGTVVEPKPLITLHPKHLMMHIQNQ